MAGHDKWLLWILIKISTICKGELFHSRNSGQQGTRLFMAAKRIFMSLVSVYCTFVFVKQSVIDGIFSAIGFFEGTERIDWLWNVVFGTV